MFWNNRTTIERVSILLVAFIVLMGTCATVRAQETPLAVSSDKTAGGPETQRFPLRNAEDAACRTSKALQQLYPYVEERDWENRWLRSLNQDARSLGLLCEEQASLTSEDPAVRRLWIMELGGYDFRLMRLLAEAAPKALTKSAKLKLTKLEDIIALLHADAGTLLTIELQHLAIPREVVKTVEVPAQCPEVVRQPDPPPPPRDPCADALRQGADRWSTQLYKWTSWYRGSGADWALADSSKAEMNNIARGNGDPRSYVVGWLAQWRAIRRQDNTSILGSGPMPQIAADMRAQLGMCGIQQPDWER